MKILLVGNHPKDGTHSMKLFAELLYSGLRRSGHDVRLAMPKLIMGSICAGQSGFNKWLSYIDQFAVFPFDLASLSRWADIVHICDHSNAPYIALLSNLRKVVTCHDTIGIRRAFGLYKETKAKWTGRLLQRCIGRSLEIADRIACVSKTVKDELLELLKMEGCRLSVVYNGLNYPFSPMPVLETQARLARIGVPLDRPFILNVGGNSWRKNRLGAIKIFQQLRRIEPKLAPRLLLVGAPLGEETAQYLGAHGLANDVLALAHADSSDLCALYSRASFLLFPSLHEGFGWPIIEAQACGCIVATSNRDPMREVSGGACILIDPEDHMSAAQVIALRVQSDRETIRRQGLERAKLFSREAMIQEYEKLYEAALA